MATLKTVSNLPGHRAQLLLLEIRHTFKILKYAMAVAPDWLQLVLAILGPTGIFAKIQFLRALLKRSQVTYSRHYRGCESLIVIEHLSTMATSGGSWSFGGVPQGKFSNSSQCSLPIHHHVLKLLNFNRLFFKLKWFICKQQCVFPVHCFLTMSGEILGA